jgi:opacity protein-like surface antigen
MSMRLVIAALAAIVATSLQAADKPAKSGHVAVNGVNYYYAVYGKGEPLLLLHGGLGLIEMFGPNLDLLAQSREVIGVDLHGHGRTDLGSREINPVDIGNDLAVLVKKLGYQKVDVLGYSSPRCCRSRRPWARRWPSR